jgi:hypothetical protein
MGRLTEITVNSHQRLPHPPTAADGSSSSRASSPTLVSSGRIEAGDGAATTAPREEAQFVFFFFKMQLPIIKRIWTMGYG